MFVSDRYKFRTQRTYARYIHHPSQCRVVRDALRKKGVEGEIRVYTWTTEEDVTNQVLKGE